MLQAFRLQQGNDALSYQADEAGARRAGVRACRRRATRRSPRPAGGSARVVGTGDDGAAVARRARSRRRARAAWPTSGARRGRSSRSSTAWCRAAGPSLDPCAPGNVYSVTELEKAAECPFRFFLKRGLGVRPVDERERDNDVWLDPLTRGSELHDIYAALLRRCRDESRRPDAEGWRLADAPAPATGWPQLHEEMPAATPEILERESRDFLADVELFLEAEVDRPDATAVGLRGVVRAAAGRRRGAAGARGAGRRSASATA